ncbi:MAG TPA: MotA/TolQ/ExbB proton channel family protein [Pyrinomonadaceae bacterium]|nr:MotA/TolQ/ExbB proton channel family protein [Pyrinomonadaceae bacterium]
MNYKKWLFGGAVLFLGSIVVGILGTVWGIYSSFKVLGNSEAGIGSVGAGIENALIFTVFAIIGSIVGMILMIIGGIKAYRQSKMKN